MKGASRSSGLSRSTVHYYLNKGDSKKKDKFGKYINSAFVVTFLGGIFISLLTFYCQYKLHQNAQHRLKWEKKLNSMELVLKEFSIEIPKLLSIAIDLREREDWIIKHKGADEKALKNIRYADQRNFYQARDYHDKLRDRYLELPSYESICLRVKVYYKSPEMAAKIDQLLLKLDAMMSYDKCDQLQTTFDEANILYRDIILLMSKQIEEAQNENS